MMDRYQNQNLLTKFYRRLKYQPYYFIKASFAYIRNFYGYYLIKNYEDYYEPSFVFKILYTDWQFKAKWTHTMEEIFSKASWRRE